GGRDGSVDLLVRTIDKEVNAGGQGCGSDRQRDDGKQTPSRPPGANQPAGARLGVVSRHRTNSNCEVLICPSSRASVRLIRQAAAGSFVLSGAVPSDVA